MTLTLNTTVTDLLPQLKANSKTYSNIGVAGIKEFQYYYSYLKLHQHKKINQLIIWDFTKCFTGEDMDYLNKIKAMRLISYNI